MKKQFWVVIIAAASLIGMSSCTVDGYVSDQPAAVVYSRPVAPGPDYVWIDGDWVWSGGTYVWHEGRWDHAREGRVWVHGSWEHHGTRGYRWHRGYWK
ncbi:MAG TPA: hypothetical protein VNU72_03685 [Puia sp.]|nr:hypothetical protein [Puia sp.]